MMTEIDPVKFIDTMALLVRSNRKLENVLTDLTKIATCMTLEARGDPPDFEFRLRRQKKMLSDRHQTVFDFIIGYKQTNDGISPSIRDIVENCQVKSTSHAGTILKKLQDLGLIHFEPKQARTIRVVGGRWSFDGDGEGGK